MASSSSTTGRAPQAYALKHTLLGHTAPLSVVRYSPDGLLLASAGADGIVNIWDTETGVHLKGLDGHKGHRKGINDLAWSADSRLLASASDDKTIRIWSVEAGKPVHTRLKGHTGAVICLSFNPQGNLLASGGQDENMIVWDVRQGLAHHTIPAHSDPISAVDFNRDGTLIVSGSWDGLIRIWDTATGQCLKTLVHEVSVPIAHISFSPNGRYLLSTTLDSITRLWTYQPAKAVKTFVLPQGSNDKFGCPTVVFLNPLLSGTKEREAGETWLVGGTEEGKIVAWEVQSRKVVLELPKAHNNSIVSISAHPSCPLLATASVSTDYTIQIFAAVDAPVVDPSKTDSPPTFTLTGSPKVADDRSTEADATAEDRGVSLDATLPLTEVAEQSVGEGEPSGEASMDVDPHVA